MLNKTSGTCDGCGASVSVRHLANRVVYQCAACGIGSNDLRWLYRMYGLNTQEGVSFLKLPQYKRDIIENDLHEWRGFHGMPASNSPLSRGYLLDAIRCASATPSQ